MSIENLYTLDDITRLNLIDKLKIILDLIIDKYPDVQEILYDVSYAFSEKKALNSKYYRLYSSGLDINNIFSFKQSFNDWLNDNIPHLIYVLELYNTAIKTDDKSGGLSKDDMEYLNAIYKFYKNT